jgi:hypothetical protein
MLHASYHVSKTKAAGLHPAGQIGAGGEEMGLTYKAAACADVHAHLLVHESEMHDEKQAPFLFGSFRAASEGT